MSKRILVADDDPVILEAIAIALEDEGYQVETTVDGTALQEMSEPLPGLLLLDIWMSGINGADICSDLKNRERTRGIPIILISANKDIQKIALESGADAFIGKPFELKELLALVEKYVH